MKKVIISITILVFSGVFAFGVTPAISATAPGSVAYAPSPGLTPKIVNVMITGTTGNYTKNMIDIKPLHPDTGAEDRTWWKLSGTPSVLANIPFKIYKTGATTFEILTAGAGSINANNVWNLNLKNTNFQSFSNKPNFDVVFNTNTNSFANGTYTKTLQLRLWNNTNSTTWPLNATNGTPVGVFATVVLTLTVSGNTTSLSVNTTSIDFGEVTTNLSRDFTATVLSTQPYTLSMKSDNNYSLEYWDPSTMQIAKISGENIGYQISIGTFSIDPSSAPAIPSFVLVANVPTVTAPQQRTDVYSVTVTLKTVTATTGGDYKDTLTFTVAAP